MFHLGAVLPGGNPGKAFEDSDKIVIIRETAGGGDLADFPFGMLGEKRFRLLYAQISDMFGDAAAIVLVGNFVETGFSDLKMAAQVGDADLLCKVRADIFVDPNRQLFPLDDGHPFQTEVGGYGLHDVGDRGDIVFRDNGTGKTGGS